MSQEKRSFQDAELPAPEDVLKLLELRLQDMKRRGERDAANNELIDVWRRQAEEAAQDKPDESPDEVSFRPN